MVKIGEGHIVHWLKTVGFWPIRPIKHPCHTENALSDDGVSRKLGRLHWRRDVTTQQAVWTMNGKLKGRAPKGGSPASRGPWAGFLFYFPLLLQVLLLLDIDSIEQESQARKDIQATKSLWIAITPIRANTPSPPFIVPQQHLTILYTPPHPPTPLSHTIPPIYYSHPAEGGPRIDLPHSRVVLSPLLSTSGKATTKQAWTVSQSSRTQKEDNPTVKRFLIRGNGAIGFHRDAPPPTLHRSVQPP